MTSKTNSDIALGDVRATSYNAATANPHGYTGTIDDALAQIRAEPDEVGGYRWRYTTEPDEVGGYRWRHTSHERYELLGFLRALKPKSELSGVQIWTNMPARYVFPLNKDEDDSVVYGAPEPPTEPGKYTLERAMRDWPQNFKQPE